MEAETEARRPSTRDVSSLSIDRVRMLDHARRILNLVWRKTSLETATTSAGSHQRILIKMLLPNGSRPLPGWQIRFPVKQAENADTYRVADEKGALAFLKVFHPDRIGADRFTTDGKLLEITIMESLDHPGIPPIRQSGVLNSGRPYFLADLVPGETLDHRLARVVAIPADAARSLMRELCAVVSYLHSLPDPVTHDELTPSNVVLGPGERDDDRPVVIDFGHARRASDGAAPHPSRVDPHYLPNECYEAPVSAPTADVFALGHLLPRASSAMPPWYASDASGGQADRARRCCGRAWSVRLPEGPSAATPMQPRCPDQKGAELASGGPIPRMPTPSCGHSARAPGQNHRASDPRPAGPGPVRGSGELMLSLASTT